MITVITCTFRNHSMKNIFDNYNNQIFEKKELIIVLNDDNMDIKKWKQEAKKYSNVTIYQLPSRITLGMCMNYAVKRANYNYIAKFDDDDYYAPYYLTEAIEVFNQSDVDIVGKRTVYVYMDSSQSLMLRPKPQMKNVRDATLVFKKKVWQQIPFKPRNQKSFWEFQNKARMRGFKIGTSSKYNYTYIRRSPEEHTFNIDQEKFLGKCEFVKNSEDFKSYIEKTPDNTNREES